MTKNKINLYPLNIIHTKNGDIRHIFDKDQKGFNGFSETYISEINPLKIKGWTLHKNKTSNLIVVKGHVKFVFVESKNPENFISYELSALKSKKELYCRICVEPNVWFAFQGLHCKVSRVLNISDVSH